MSSVTQMWRSPYAPTLLLFLTSPLSPSPRETGASDREAEVHKSAGHVNCLFLTLIPGSPRNTGIIKPPREPSIQEEGRLSISGLLDRQTLVLTEN